MAELLAGQLRAGVTVKLFFHRRLDYITKQVLYMSAKLARQLFARLAVVDRLYTQIVNKDIYTVIVNAHADL
jgi:hypothetical protein